MNKLISSLLISCFLGIAAQVTQWKSTDLSKTTMFASSGGGGGTITPVGSPTCPAGTYVSTTTDPISYTSAGAGNTLVVGVLNEAGTATSSVTDNISQTYVHSVGPVSAADGYIDMFTKISTGAGVTTVTPTFASAPNAYIEVCISEYSGVVHIGNTNSDTSSFTGTTYSISNTLTYANDYNVLFIGSQDSSVQTPTATAGTVRAYNATSYRNTWIQDNHSASTGSLAVSGTVGANTGGAVPMAVLELENH